MCYNLEKTKHNYHTHPVLQVVNSTASFILSIVVQDCISVCPVKGSLYLQIKHIYINGQVFKTLVFYLSNIFSVAKGLLTSWRNTNPEIPATNSARKTRDRNMAYYKNREPGGTCCIVCIVTFYSSFD